MTFTCKKRIIMSARNAELSVRRLRWKQLKSAGERLGYLYGQELGIHTALTVDGGYMVLSREKKDPSNSYETVLDSPRLKEDYGIYFFPLVEYLPENVVSMDGRNPERVADMEQLGNVFPLGDEVNAVNLYYYREADQLILVTEEAGHIWATIIDRKSMTELQKILIKLM